MWVDRKRSRQPLCRPLTSGMPAISTFTLVAVVSVSKRHFHTSTSFADPFAVATAWQV